MLLEKDYRDNVYVESQSQDKEYTDIAVETSKNNFVLIELKFKTPDKQDLKNHKDIVYTNTKNGRKVHVYPMGACDEGSFLFWKDVERLEGFVIRKPRKPFIFDDTSKVYKAFAIILSNDCKYWQSHPKSLASNFFLPDKETIFNDRFWKIAIDKGTGKKIDGKKKNKGEIIEIKSEKDAIRFDCINKKPVQIRGKYETVWNDYNTSNVKANLASFNFRYLIFVIEN